MAKRRIKQLCCSLALIVAIGEKPALAQRVLPAEHLYRGTAPGSESWKLAEITKASSDGGVTYGNVRDPEFTVYLPAPSKANGAAVLFLPGGGLRSVGFGKVTRDLIALLNERGVAVITLKYRVLQADPGAPRPAGPPPWKQPVPIRNGNANPEPDNEALKTVLTLATADAQEAMRRVRSHATEWGIDIHRVGMFGESAGGGVMFGVLEAGETASMPNFLISNFGPALQDVRTETNLPPLFMSVEAGHGLVVDGLRSLMDIWRDAKRPVELHIYDVPNFSMQVSLFGQRMLDWMVEQKIIPAGS